MGEITERKSDWRREGGKAWFERELLEKLGWSKETGKFQCTYWNSLWMSPMFQPLAMVVFLVICIRMFSKRSLSFSLNDIHYSHYSHKCKAQDFMKSAFSNYCFEQHTMTPSRHHDPAPITRPWHPAPLLALQQVFEEQCYFQQYFVTLSIHGEQITNLSESDVIYMHQIHFLFAFYKMKATRVYFQECGKRMRFIEMLKDFSDGWMFVFLSADMLAIIGTTLKARIELKVSYQSCQSHSY